MQQRDKLKIIGTVGIDEINRLNSDSRWRQVTMNDVPFSVLGTPSGFMFAHGSVSNSLATTNHENWTYLADLCLYRQDKNIVKRYRYLGSVTPDKQVAILLVPKDRTPDHHVTNLSQAQNCLPTIYQDQVRIILSGTVT